MSSPGGWGRRLAYGLALAAASASCAHRPSAPGRYAQAVAALSSGRSADYYQQIIALAHQQPDGRAGRRARAILCSGSGPLDVLLARAQALSLAPQQASGPMPSSTGRASAQTLDDDGSVDANEAPAMLARLAALQEQFHGEHQRYCRDFVECPLPVSARAHYFYFLSEHAVVGGSDSEATVEAEPDIRAWLGRQKLRPHTGKRSYLAVAVGLLGQSRVDVWTLNERGEVQQLGRPAAPSP